MGADHQASCPHCNAPAAPPELLPLDRIGLAIMRRLRRYRLVKHRGFATIADKKTIANRIRILEAARYVWHPYGERSGAAPTQRGLAALEAEEASTQRR